ncbi:MAG: tetratricopeptide repeat protein [Bradymonadaceae bacterium]|nr:tetratricopeptide repeat protein [Lujinxingiaceae bacterium]
MILQKSWAFWLIACAIVLIALGCAGVDKKQEESLKTAQWHYEMAAGYFESNEVPLAIRELTFCLENNPDHEQANYLLGFIYMGRRNYTKAVVHFRDVLRVNPKYHFAKNNLGAVFLAMGRWQEAEEVYLELLDEPLYTTLELAHNNVGWAYYNMRRYSEALEHFRMASFLKPEMCLADNNLGLTFEAMNNRSEAVSAYRRAINKCPINYQEPHLNLGKILQEQGDERARLHFQRCVELQPNSTVAERCREYLRLR